MTDVTDTADGGNRAVSPVIGVILMVAITVILAAVIGAFVLEIGDQQETAPNTSFDSEQRTEFFLNPIDTTKAEWCDPDPACANDTVVEISHAGGAVIDVSQAEIVVNGNDSVWGAPTPEPAWGDPLAMYPQPNILPTLGTNEEVTFTSGESWQTVGYGGDVPEHWSNSYDRLWSDQRLAAGNYRGKPFEDLWQVLYNGYGSMNEPVAMNDLQSGDTVNVVWTAESGGKTQTLFKYTVQ